METTLPTPAAQINKAAYLSARAAWKQLAHEKQNTARSFISYIITQALYLTDKLGADEAAAWALRKLRAGFTPSQKTGRATLWRELHSTASHGIPFLDAGRSTENPAVLEMRQRFTGLADYLRDEIRLEAK